MAVRDRVVLAIVGGGALVLLAAGRLGGPWPALGVGLLVVLAAGAAYRVVPPRLPPDPWPEEPATDDEAGRPVEAASADGVRDQ